MLQWKKGAPTNAKGCVDFLAISGFYVKSELHSSCYMYWIITLCLAQGACLAVTCSVHTCVDFRPQARYKECCVRALIFPPSLLTKVRPTRLNRSPHHALLHHRLFLRPRCRLGCRHPHRRA